MKKGVQINFNISNRVAYTLMAFLVLSIMGVGVYATSHTTASHTPTEVGISDPAILDGVSWGELIDKPTLTCISDNQILKWDSVAGDWVCGTDSPEVDTLQTVTSRGFTTTGGITVNGEIKIGASTGWFSDCDRDDRVGVLSFETTMSGTQYTSTLKTCLKHGYESNPQYSWVTIESLKG